MKTDLRIDNLEFVDFPRQVFRQEYNRNEREFVNYFQRHPVVAAIYKIGSVSNPGISDLDLILVLRENRVLERRDYEFLTGIDEYIFAHRPFVISETLFPYIYYLFYPSNLCNLAGDSYTFHRPASSTERSQLAWLICAEAALSRLCDIVYQATWKSSISIRRMLLKLNSIKHNINLLQNVDETIVITEPDGFISQIFELRKSWFSFHKEEQIKETLRTLYKGITILLEIIDELALLSRDVFNLSLENQMGGYFLFPNSLQILKFKPEAKTGIKTITNPFCFLRKISKNYKPKIIRHVNDISIITLPYELIYLFSPTGPEGSNTAKTIKGNLIMRGEDNPFRRSQGNYSAAMLERFRLVDQYNDFIKRNNFSAMSFLLMAPWLTSRKAKFYDFKKIILKSMLKLRLI